MQCSLPGIKVQRACAKSVGELGGHLPSPASSSAGAGTAGGSCSDNCCFPRTTNQGTGGRGQIAESRARANEARTCLQHRCHCCSIFRYVCGQWLPGGHAWSSWRPQSRRGRPTSSDEFNISDGVARVSSGGCWLPLADRPHSAGHERGCQRVNARCVVPEPA